MEPTSNQRFVYFTVIVTAIVLISTLHFSMGMASTREHAYHVILRSLYVLPIIGASIWFGLRGGVLSALTVSMIYGTHVLTTWQGSTMENTSQAAMIVMYFVIGGVAGGMSGLEDKQRRARQQLEARMQRDMIVNALEILGKTLKWRDSYTQRHSESVADLAVAIGRESRMTPNQLDRVRLAARVHDIGKIGVRDDVLLKPGKLSQAEQKAIEQHPEVAADILRSIPGTAELAAIVVAHHECPDGSGYPRGLIWDQIPLEAHTLRVADVYCAMTEDRPYHSGVERERALSLMEEMSGSRLDTAALSALKAVLRRNNHFSESVAPTASIQPGHLEGAANRPA